MRFRADIRTMTIRAGANTLLPLCTFLLWVGSLSLASAAHAQFDPAAPAPIEKLRGSLILVASGNPTAANLEMFSGLAGGDKANIVLLFLDAEAKASAAPIIRLLQDNLPRGAILTLLSAPELLRSSGPHPQLESATGVWMWCGKSLAAARSKVVKSSLESDLRAVVNRGGVVGGSGHAAVLLGSDVPVQTSSSQKPKSLPGIGLLAGSAIEPTFEGKDKKDEFLDWIRAHPDVVGFGLEPGTALLLRQRYLRCAGPGRIHITIAGNDTRPTRTQTLSGNQTGDLISLSRSARARTHRPFPPSRLPEPKVTSGTLLLGGGGNISRKTISRFIELAGGKDALLLFVPCMQAEEIRGEPGFVGLLKSLGATNVRVFHTKDRKKASEDRSFLDLVRKAGGIWFGGGRQWNFVDSYQHTTTHKLMHEVLSRGGVIGGSSAGASIQADYLGRGDPLGNTNIIAEGYEEGLGFLTGVAVDQHFSRRGREPDLQLLVKTYPQVLGIGLDESTVLWVTGSRGTVEGQGTVTFIHHKRDGSLLERAVLKDGESFDLAARRETE